MYTVIRIQMKDEIIKSKINFAIIFNQYLSCHVLPKVSILKITERREDQQIFSA
jgi:hypothetical protein